MEEIVSMAKRRGFVFQSSEIYGGINGFWDFGPVGVLLRNNIKQSWWKRMVEWRDDIAGIDTSIIAHPETWKASGHLDCFSDPMVDCKKCKGRFRADHLKDAICPEKPSKKPGECGGELTEPRSFNLMFKTYVGPVEDQGSIAYLRPETCQSIFTQFKNVMTTARKKIPFGIAQIGKSFRNEITPRNFIFRSREFEQMEMEYFIRPGDEEGEKWYKYWYTERLNWFYSLGVKKEKLRLRPHEKDELAHYAKGCVDIEYEFPMGWSELEGIANRASYDLSQHIKFSKKDLQYFDDAKKEKYVPSVIECSVGVDRTFLTLLCDAYHKDTVDGEERIVLKFAPSIAPYKVAVFPLSKKLEEKTQKIEKDLRKKFMSDYDDSGSIGKRYRRHDEIGTPFCVTIDFETENDGKATIRHRDTTKQERIDLNQIENFLNEHVQMKE
ncbi:MAG: glycine--tRNA ligase [Deltaproteobacteria bacterium RIFCSPLOWO2_12_FULL_40_28]|nr:MAG: glycine--tRNA ligase [Deltaproteobacteria bacterium RIFCSPHIGHO2_02_FULL_40_28]OGQ20057.1 MAG: glycine--tRNA ligase [Deltaproteobacteria bacterium RIFCSPHIGHO2_12_FULL_40_32]OGQ40624.1 MAG: glycine--tRNA ligase [Deltaproteobacteria bacterium RIFCSPLOWO2_02_FULL_40_36]OGQ54293.1 MAG: glycine--tRNA ligase [Deltaproteobacteria bacterium RIFCSPLOWO2_12_FULL_40_28]